jgi:hypothetical protein
LWLWRLLADFFAVVFRFAILFLAAGLREATFLREVVERADFFVFLRAVAFFAAVLLFGAAFLAVFLRVVAFFAVVFLFAATLRFAGLRLLTTRFLVVSSPTLCRSVIFSPFNWYFYNHFFYFITKDKEKQTKKAILLIK